MQPSSGFPAQFRADGEGTPFAVETRDLTRRFGGATALDRVTLAIRKGEFFSLLGPSGAGKTTLLRVVAGLDAPDSGQLRLDGQDALPLPPHARHVKLVFQSYALFPHLTVEENIGFGLRLRKMPRRELRERVGRVMESVRLRPLGARRPAQLSGGEQQRVALARALVSEPAVLLLDEPLGALDAGLRRELQSELRQLQRRLGITFLHVTHDQDEALRLSDRVAVMHAGRLMQVDAPAALYERPRNRFVAAFLGACNLLAARVVGREGNHLRVETRLGPLRLAPPATPELGTPGRQVSLAIRPEKVILAPPAESGAPNGFPVRVTEATFRGADTEYRLEAQGCELTAAAPNAQTTGDWLAAGRPAHCRLPEDALIVLED